jgi:hypothetical protein
VVASLPAGAFAAAAVAREFQLARRLEHDLRIG